MDGQLSELREMLAEMEIAFLTTIGSDGHLRSRPMQLQRHDPDGTLWFATSLDSHKIDDVRHDGRCCVAFLKDSAYVSISGRAELVKDRSLIEKMWKPTWRGWFPEGPGEPELVLLKVAPQHVEYVHPSGGTVKSLFTQIKNAITHSHEEPAPKKELDLGRSR
ncbi:MAG: pyridoxamine 5-phosphate oxidase [Deltaproteobacteria bacterium]|nr:MAG: pyridoxamine 5-phosphate oxidase [Deltaproteobacteria bacterium]TMB26171.1 MAG: pyridoxamine 5-phosphate oxidase [Deltaproteobacteria bacterium]